MSKQSLTESSAISSNDLITITINLQKLHNLIPHYESSEFTIKVELHEQCLLETPKKLLSQEIDVEEIIELPFDPQNYNHFDQILSNPLVITVVESKLENGGVEIFESGKAWWRTEESVVDLQEALFGKSDASDKNEEEVKKKSKKSSKTSKDKLSKDDSTKGSKISKLSDKLKVIPDSKDYTTVFYFDLIGLLEGEILIKKSCITRLEQVDVLDDRLKSIANLPRIDLEIKVDKTIPVGKIINFTLESIYNPPQVFSSSMKYQTLLELPITHAQKINFNRCIYQDFPRKKFQHKKWFGNTSDCDYFLEDNYDDIHTKLGKIEEILPQDYPRLEFNTMKRIYLSEADYEDLKLHIVKRKCLPIEILITKPDVVKSTIILDNKPSKDSASKATSKKSKTKQKTPSTEENKDLEDCIHLMTYIDINKLLYPGQKRQRVISHLRTFNHEEFTKTTGITDSHFRPKNKKVDEQEEIHDLKKAEKKENQSKKSGSGKDAKIKGGNLKSKLPKEPPPQETSQAIFDENGFPTFIIMDVELQESFIPPRNLQDITDELDLILAENGVGTNLLPKNITSTRVTTDLYNETITSVIKAIKKEYLEYSDEVGGKEEKNDEKNFLKYLQHKGVYQNYLASITRAATTYVDTNFNYKPESGSNEYYTFISSIYMDLIKKMNRVIYKFFNTTSENGNSEVIHDNLVDYAFEALELNAYELANRYFLQNIIDDDKNPDNWFYYAIYHMHLEEHEKAFECALEALKIDKSHRNSLILYALILGRKKKISEAETCLLNVVLEDAMWVEGWGALYCIYQLGNNLDGSEVALEMAAKFLETPAIDLKDLSWNKLSIPNTVFYRTACYFITLRLYDEAELMISAEIFRKNEGTAEYLLAVIGYYKRSFDHALIHIDNAISLSGGDATMNMLRGHILLGKDDPKCALEEYAKISYQFSQPDESAKYFLYIQEGLCYSRLGEIQKARINFLHASKIRGSPYTWLCTGVLFYHQMDYLSAEQCLTQANTMDSWMPEIWAYLCRVNIKMKRVHEADMCYQQMIKNRLWNPDLQEIVERELLNI